jgi:hypothetical protein
MPDKSNTYTVLEHVGYLQEQSMTLSPSFSEPGCSLLVGKLNETKGRLKTVDKQHLNILFVD